MLSEKGKNASLPRETPVILERYSFLSSAVSGSGRVVTALLVYLATGLHSPWWGALTLAAAAIAHSIRALRLSEVKTVFGLWALPFLAVMGFNLAEKLGHWRDLAVSTPVYAVVLTVSLFMPRSYGRR